MKSNMFKRKNNYLKNIYIFKYNNTVNVYCSKNMFRFNVLVSRIILQK